MGLFLTLVCGVCLQSLRGPPKGANLAGCQESGLLDTSEQSPDLEAKSGGIMSSAQCCQRESRVAPGEDVNEEELLHDSIHLAYSDRGVHILAQASNCNRLVFLEGQLCKRVLA